MNTRAGRKHGRETGAKHASPTPGSKPQTSKTTRRRRAVQAQIGYEALMDSGLMWCGGDTYSVTLKLSDIDYQLAPPDVQENLIEKYAHFLNGHLSGQHVQITVVNRVLDAGKLASDVQIPLRGDGFDTQRGEYNALIRERLAAGRRNTATEKYVTLSVDAPSLDEAKTVLGRIAAEDAALLREVGGCVATQLTGRERVLLMQHMLRPGVEDSFTYSELVGQAMTTKDVVTPMAIDARAKDFIRLSSENERLWQVLVLRKLPPGMSDRVIKELADIPADVTVSIHIDPLDQADGLKLVKSQLASMDIERSNEQRKLAKQNLSYDLLPHELQASYDEAAELRSQLEQSNEKLFRTTIVVGVAGADEDTLAENVTRVKRVCSKHSCELETLSYMQRDALNAILPLGTCTLPMFRTLTTAVAAVMVPFTTQEIMDAGGNFYGMNALSKNLIMADRMSGMNANGFILGTTGSGKSQFAKFEMTQTFLRRANDEILIIDPEREYPPLARELGAARVVISPGSRDALNALEIDKHHRGEDDPIRAKCAFVLSLCEVLIGGMNGLSAQQRSIIDRCSQTIYRRFMSGESEPMPTLATLYEELRAQDDLVASQIADALELYARGSGSGFAQETNVDLDQRVVVYDLADLGKDLQTFGMMVVLDNIWARIVRNKARGVRTWLYIDEFHLLFANEYAAEYCQSIFKRVRKYGAAATGITQNIEELLGNERARLMLSNSDGLFLLNQQSTDADALMGLLKLSSQQRSYFTNVSPGCGLLRTGNAVVPFDNTMNTRSHIFELFSTSFNEHKSTERGS